MRSINIVARRGAVGGCKYAADWQPSAYKAAGVLTVDLHAFTV